MIPADKLTDMDFKLLKYVYKALPEYIELKSLLSKFDDAEATLLRIEELSKLDYSQYDLPIRNTSYLEFDYESYIDKNGLENERRLDRITITPLGRKVFTDYLFTQKKQRNNKIEERLWKSISLIALIISILSFLQSIHVIDLVK